MSLWIALALAGQSGDVLDLGGGRTATVVKADALPFVDSEYSRRFRFDGHDNPKLKELRETQGLDEVVAPGRDEFERQVLLLDWTHRRFRKFGRPSANPRGALEILRDVDAGHTFYCAHYASVFCSAAASLGWVDRTLALRRHKDYPGSGAPEHTSTEIWSNQHRKWVMMDPTANLVVEKDGVPLNAYEIRTEWFERGGAGLVFVVGKERKRHRKADLPVVLGRFPGFGNLTLKAEEMEKYGFTGYVPNTNLMDERPDWGTMFVVKDRFCEGTKWHVRTVPADPARDGYFPIGQASPSLAVEDGRVRVTFRTLTPNFREYRVRLDGGEWRACDGTLLWTLQPGSNRLEARTLNRFGVEGPLTTIELELQ